MSKYWTDLVGRLDPYTPGEQPQDKQYVKLNTNESPYPPSPKVAEVLQKHDSDSLRLYPDPESTALRQALADYHGLALNQVFVGNGSDEVLAHAFQAFFKQSQALLFPDISYSFYPVYCALYDIEFEKMPLDESFQIQCADYSKANGGIILPNPNAPSGIALPLADIRKLLENANSAVIIDEAYVDFGTDSADALIAEFDNLLVVRSFSKSRNLAGIRLGYALGNENLIEALNRIKNSFNSYPVDRLASAIAIASIADEAYFKACNDKIIRNRNSLTEALSGLNFQVYPSSSNFIFVQHRTEPAAKLYQSLKAAGILVRYFKSARIDNCLRITIGDEQQNQQLIQALQSILAE